MILEFPLNPDDKKSILYSLFIYGEATLTAGSVTIINPRITPNSIGLVSRKTTGGTIGDLRITCNSGSATITSTSGTDTSKVYYLILI